MKPIHEKIMRQISDTDQNQPKLTRFPLIGCGAGLTLVSIALHFQKTLDFHIQGYLYRNGAWLIDANEPTLRLVFYNLARSLPWLAGLMVILYALLMRRRREAVPNLWPALIFMGVLPALANFLKAATGQACPDSFQSFHGPLPDLLLFQAGSRCFPGGHVSSGLALLGVGLLMRSSLTRILSVGAIIGWSAIIGFYQMAKGAHFLSDTLATAGIAMLLYGILKRTRGAGKIV